jgi:hypothetical protein
MKRFALGLCVVTALSLAASCIIAYVDNPSYGPDGGAFNYQKSVAFAPGGTVAVVNTNGDIRVRGWDEARVEVRAGEQGARREGRRFRIGGIGDFEPDIRFRLDEDQIKIQCPDEADRDSVYDFEIRVPRSVKIQGIRNGEGRIVVADVYGRLDVEAERGEVIVENFSGALDVSLGEGDVLAEVLDMRPEDEIRVEVEEGDIEVFLQEPVGAALEIDAENGEITSEMELGRPLPARTLEVKPERASGRIVLKAGNGDIRIRRSSEAKRGD